MDQKTADISSSQSKNINHTNQSSSQHDHHHLISPSVYQYIKGLLGKYDEKTLLEMESLAREKSFPIIDRPAGTFLMMLTQLLHPQRIFEFGSGFGYSAYWFAKAMEGRSEGEIICTDGDKENTIMAKKFLLDDGKIKFHTGWAQKIFRENYSGEKFCIIYNDVDKKDYPEVWNLSKNAIRPGGLYIADNSLWSARVAMEKPFQDLYPGWTEAIKEHNQLIAEDQNFDLFLNPIRDGLIVARRKH